MEPAPVPLGVLTEALRRGGLIGAADTVAELSRVVGRQVETLSLHVGDGRNIWVQRLVDARQWDQATRTVRALRRQPGIVDSARDRVCPVLPCQVAPDLFAAAVPVRAELVVDPLLRPFGAPRATARWPWLAPLCDRLGTYLRALHESSLGLTQPPDVPQPNHVVASVRGILISQVDLRAVRSVAGQVAAMPRLREGLADALRGFGTEPHRVLLHGRFAPAYVLRPVARAHHGSPRADAYVIGWLDATLGPPAYDVGHFVGELMELAAAARAIGRADAEASYREAAATFYAAYLARSTEPVPHAFSTQVAAFAALKIVEHVVRFATLYGDGRSETGWVRATLAAADELLCPRQGLAAALAGGPRRGLLGPEPGEE